MVLLGHHSQRGDIRKLRGNKFDCGHLGLLSDLPLRALASADLVSVFGQIIAVLFRLVCQDRFPHRQVGPDKAALDDVLAVDLQDQGKLGRENGKERE